MTLAGSVWLAAIRKMLQALPLLPSAGATVEVKPSFPCRQMHCRRLPSSAPLEIEHLLFIFVSATVNNSLILLSKPRSPCFTHGNLWRGTSLAAFIFQLSKISNSTASSWFLPLMPPTSHASGQVQHPDSSLPPVPSAVQCSSSICRRRLPHDLTSITQASPHPRGKSAPCRHCPPSCDSLLIPSRQAPPWAGVRRC